VDSERTIAAKTGPRKRSAPEVAPAAEMPTAEMPAAVTAEMATTVKMPATAVTTSTMAAAAAMTTAAFRGSIARGCQHGCKNNDGNSNIEFRHRTLRRRRHLNLR
jgi:hypothetical protein